MVTHPIERITHERVSCWLVIVMMIQAACVCVLARMGMCWSNRPTGFKARPALMTGGLKPSSGSSQQKVTNEKHCCI